MANFFDISFHWNCWCLLGFCWQAFWMLATLWLIVHARLPRYIFSPQFSFSGFKNHIMSYCFLFFFFSTPRVHNICVCMATVQVFFRLLHAIFWCWEFPNFVFQSTFYHYVCIFFLLYEEIKMKDKCLLWNYEIGYHLNCQLQQYISAPETALCCCTLPLVVGTSCVLLQAAVFVAIWFC